MNSLTEDLRLVICMFLEPKDLVSIGLVRKGWELDMKIAWEELMKNKRLDYLTYKKRSGMEMKKLCFLCWTNKSRSLSFN